MKFNQNKWNETLLESVDQKSTDFNEGIRDVEDSISDIKVKTKSKDGTLFIDIDEIDEKKGLITVYAYHEYKQPPTDKDSDMKFIKSAVTKELSKFGKITKTVKESDKNNTGALEGYVYTIKV